MKPVITAFFVAVIFIVFNQAHADQMAVANSVYDFKVKTMEDQDKSLADYHGQVLLIVNTASHCGFTPQYAGLEKLYERYKARGFVVLAFPANDFLDQEPGNDNSIRQFCELTYKTSFPLFSKISVRGDQIAPLYQYLTTASGFNGSITWNFNKFLVNRKGQVIARYGSKTDPMDPGLEEDVLRALAESGI
jgi:glutathione peroxidase-family protein